MKTTKIKLIGLIDSMPDLIPNDYGRNEIKITIAVLADDGRPRNYSRDWNHPPVCTGGCFARIFASAYTDTQGVTEPTRHILGWYGPSISYGDCADYKAAFKACDAIQKKLERMYQERGSAIDAAEEMGRFLTACGVTEVYDRPNGGSRSGWLNEGEWIKRTVGQTVFECRAHFHKGAQPVAA